MIYGNSVGGIGIERTYILVDENGNEYPATFVDNETIFDATANDIRLGKVAATDIGMVTGEKDIPAYHTSEGYSIITAGKELSINKLYDKCQYTKILALVCSFNTSLNNSVATQMVTIGDNVYAVGSTEALAALEVDVEKQIINFGITNDSGSPYIIRFMTYKEEL